MVLYGTLANDQRIRDLAIAQPSDYECCDLVLTCGQGPIGPSGRLFSGKSGQTVSPGESLGGRAELLDDKQSLLIRGSGS